MEQCVPLETMRMDEGIVGFVASDVLAFCGGECEVIDIVNE